MYPYLECGWQIVFLRGIEISVDGRCRKKAEDSGDKSNFLDERLAVILQLDPNERSDDYGLAVWGSSSKIQIVSPLTKE